MSVTEAIKKAARPAALGIMLVAAGMSAQAQQPSASAMANAKELITVTGATTLFGPLIAGVVEQARNLYLQQDPGLARDLNEIAAQLRNAGFEDVRMDAHAFATTELIPDAYGGWMCCAVSHSG